MDHRGAGTLKARHAAEFRFIYLDDGTTTNISTNDVLLYRTVRHDQPAPAKVAFYVFSKLQYGMVRMFQSLMQNDLLSIEIFRDTRSAAKWLEFDEGLLKSELP